MLVRHSKSSTYFKGPILLMCNKLEYLYMILRCHLLKKLRKLIIKSNILFPLVAERKQFRIYK